MVYIRMLSYVLGKFENSDLDESSLRKYGSERKIANFLILLRIIIRTWMECNESRYTEQFLY